VKERKERKAKKPMPKLHEGDIAGILDELSGKAPLPEAPTEEPPEPPRAPSAQMIIAGTGYALDGSDFPDRKKASKPKSVKCVPPIATAEHEVRVNLIAGLAEADGSLAEPPPGKGWLLAAVVPALDGVLAAVWRRSRVR
jgi:hypothetical protein